MEILVEFLLELVVDGGIEASGNKNLSRWIRYPLMVLVILFFCAVIALVFYMGVSVYTEEPVASVLFCLLGLFLLVGTILKFRKLYMTKQPKREGEGTSGKGI